MAHDLAVAAEERGENLRMQIDLLPLAYCVLDRSSKRAARRLVCDDGHMPNLVELEAISRDVGGCLEYALLGRQVGLAGRLFITETSCTVKRALPSFC